MLAKLLVIIGMSGATALSLLAMRQQRIEAAHEMSRLHRRLIDDERLLWSLRQDIHRRCSPEEVRILVERLGGDWDAIPGGPALLIEPGRLQLVGDRDGGFSIEPGW